MAEKYPPPPPARRIETPQVTRRDPSLITVAGTSTPVAPLASRSSPLAHVPRTLQVAPGAPQGSIEPSNKSKCWRCKKYLYNREKGTVCDRDCRSWLAIIAYSIMYLIFLSTYTMVFLYASLEIIKTTTDIGTSDGLIMTSLDFADDVGLTVTPTSENPYPLIWYTNGETKDYEKYVRALDKLLVTRRRKREARSVDLGPCGSPPYGYGDQPCVILRINKQLRWSAKPLNLSSPKAKQAPKQVQSWLRLNEPKYWLQCSGYHSYDKEHIGNIRYYPDPPGFDSDHFPLKMDDSSPLVAVQVSNFTLGVSLTIECRLWYENGVASVEFMLYVAPKGRGLLRNNSDIHL